MAKYTIEDTTLSAIADAIRSKEGSSELIAVLEMAQRILDIQTGIDTSDATATEADVLNGQTFYANGVKKTGSIPVFVEYDETIPDDFFTTNIRETTYAIIPEGFYKEGIYVVGPSFGDLTKGTAYESHILEGYVAWRSGTKVTGTMPHHTVDDHNVVWTLADVPTGSGAAKMVVQLPEGFYDGATYEVGTLNMHQPQSTITPDVSDVSLPGGAWYMNGVTVKGDANLIAANIKSGVSIFGKAGTFTSDGTAVAANILSGKIAYSKGSKITGTMPSKAAATITPGTSDQTISKGRYLSGDQTIKGDANLVAANIKSGVSIFGVAGSLEEVNIDTELATQLSLLTQIENALYAKENPGAPSSPK